MKNKETTKKSFQKTKSSKNTQPADATSDLPKKPSGPSKSQINRLKKFYNTTRWLPNSAFTTYFGKPAFENYGYGNTNPTYGGLFYGNYMLSHNMNPIDGANHPPEKQVYSSAMYKSLQRGGVRRPSPPRKVPEEIRNTPEELEEIRTRAQIFQLPNNCPARDIIPPNLLKAKYFRSGKNTPVNSEDENEDEYEEWNIENVLMGKKNKKKVIKKKGEFNPYKQGRVELKRKKMKESLDNKFSGEFYEKSKKNKKGEEEYYEVEESEGQLNFEKQRDYYLKMLGEDKVKNLEDLTQMEVEKNYQNEQNIINENEQNLQNQNLQNLQNQNLQNLQNQNLDLNKEHIEGKCNWSNCPLCKNLVKTVPCNPLKPKENPALLPPSSDLIKDVSPNFVCCLHHSQLPFNQQEKNPRNYQGMPSCMMDSVIPAGKPSHLVAPLNIFQ